MSESRVPPARFVALDVHTHDVMMAAVDRFDGWSAQQVRPSDAVVLEATTNAWRICQNSKFGCANRWWRDLKSSFSFDFWLLLTVVSGRITGGG